MNHVRRSRRLYARSVLRARRAGFLTPEARRLASGSLMQLPPQVGQFTHLCLSPLGGSEAAWLSGMARVELSPLVTRPRVPGRRRPRKAGPVPGAGHLSGGVLKIGMALPADSSWLDVLEPLRSARAVRVEAWEPVEGEDGQWMVLSFPRVADVAWGPGAVEVDADWVTFDVLEGAARPARSGPYTQFGIRPEGPVLVT